MVTEQAVRSLVGTALSCTNKYNMNAHLVSSRKGGSAPVPEPVCSAEGNSLSADEPDSPRRPGSPASKTETRFRTRRLGRGFGNDGKEKVPRGLSATRN